MTAPDVSPDDLPVAARIRVGDIPPPGLQESPADEAPARVTGIHCIVCGTEWNGVLLRDPCPQCRAPMEDSVRVAALDPATLVVNDDVLCPDCDYNLRTLPLQGVCPECASPVVRALRPQRLLYANRASIRRLRAGVICWLVAQGLMLALVGALFAVALTSPPSDPSAALLLILALAMVVLWLVGAVLLTTRRLKKELTLKQDWPGRVGRWLMVIALVVQPLFLLFGRVVFPSLVIASGMWPLLVVQLTPGVFLLGVAFIIMHLRQIARMADRRSLASFTSVTLWMCAIISVLIGTGGVLSFMVTTRIVRTAMSTATTIAYTSAPYGASPVYTSGATKAQGKKKANTRTRPKKTKGAAQSGSDVVTQDNPAPLDVAPDSATTDAESTDPSSLTDADSPDSSSSDSSSTNPAPGSGSNAPAAASTTSPLVALGYTSGAGGATPATSPGGASPSGGTTATAPPPAVMGVSGTRPGWWMMIAGLLMGACYLATIVCFILGAILLIRYYGLFDKLLSQTAPRSP